MFFRSKIETQKILENVNGEYINVFGTRYNIQKDTTISNEAIKYINYNKVYDFFNTGNIGFYVNENSSFKFGDSNFSQFKGPQNLFTFLKLQSLVEEQFNKYIDFDYIYNLEFLSNNSLGYFITKNVDATNYQNIGITIDNKISNYEFVDSQLEYGKNVAYSAYSMDLIPEINNSYNKISYNNDTLFVNCTTNLKIGRAHV